MEPLVEIRYDSLYIVESCTIQTDSEGKKYYLGVLVCLIDQPPKGSQLGVLIELLRPLNRLYNVEYASPKASAVLRIEGYFSC